MSPEPLLAILYDLSQVISSEKRLHPLLKRVLQRLLFHTSLPAGMVLLGAPGERMAACAAVVGEPALADRQGKWLTVPDAVLLPEPGWLSQEVLRAFCLSGRWEQALRLPIPGAGVVLLLLPAAAAGQRPEMASLLMPAMQALGPAVAACMDDEQARLLLSQDRDQARHELAAALRESQERLRLLRQLSDSLPDMVWLKSMDGRYLFGNKALCRLLGCTEQTLLGSTDDQLFDLKTAGLHLRQDAQAGASTQMLRFEQSLHDADGRETLLEVSKVLVADEAGQPLGIMGIARDITRQKAQERELRQAASVFTHANEGIMITNVHGHIVDVNQAFTRITGYPRQEVVGRNARLLNSGRQDANFYQTMWLALATQGYWVGQLWNRRRNGEVYPQQMTISAVQDESGQTQQYVALLHDVSEQMAYEQQLRRAAHYDGLTGLPNRVLIGEILARETARAQQSGRRTAVAYLDLDGFKDINDRHGHSIGDALLVEVSRRMEAVLPSGDVLARIGGDEFIVMLTGVDDALAAQQRIQALLPVAARPVQVAGLDFQVTVSIGLAVDAVDGPADPELLIRQADQAMYQAKLQGKNRCCVFELANERELRYRQEQLDEIRSGLVLGQFVLHYQPKVNMRTGQLLGVEALLRWQHPRRGLLLPDQFLPLVEEHELAVVLGKWVINTALEQIAAWHDQGLQVQVSVNIGARHLQHACFLQELKQMLDDYPQVAPNRLQLEIVETSALDDIEHASGLLLACRSLGASSAIDDFGTGYSSLSYLKRLPVQLLKIDKSFVSEMLHDPDDLSILEGIIGLARAFDREVIAEGVESEDHGIVLLQLGCEQGQGYGIARPMPAARLVGWLRQWAPPASWMHANVTDPGAVTLMRVCIYLRSWMKGVSDYAAGVSDFLPELEPDNCLFARWMARNDVQRRISAPLRQLIDEQHLAMHVVGKALVAAMPDAGSPHFCQLQQQLLDKGQATIDCLMQQTLLRLDGPEEQAALA